MNDQRLGSKLSFCKAVAESTALLPRAHKARMAITTMMVVAPPKRGVDVQFDKDAMSSLNVLPTVGLQQQSRVVCFLSKPGARVSTSWAWRASFSTQSLGLEAKKQRLHSLATALCVPLRKQQTHVDQDTLSGNLFVEIIMSIFRDLQNGVLFILKQPKEFRYLEFPSLQSAGKMAIFTIAVVMVLIVFLATVDSGLSFIVACVFRRIR